MQLHVHIHLLLFGAIADLKLFMFLQVWGLGSPVPNFTLEGHDKGVNCIDYFAGGDKPYLISGADDRFVPQSNPKTSIIAKTNACILV